MKHRQHALWLTDIAEGLAVERRLAVGRTVVRGVPSAPALPPTVTVVVLCYNYGRFLGPCVESVLDQRDVDLRVVIVDDASTDDTPRVARQLVVDDPRVSVIRNQANRGQLPSMNAAIEAVETDYVVKLDADDLLSPGSLARSTALMEAHPEVTLVYGRPLHFSGGVPQPRDLPARSWTLWDGRAWFARRCRSGANIISQPEALMPTKAIRQVGPVREYLPHTFDMHLWLQLSVIGDVGRVNGPPQGYYRVHDQSLQRTAHAGTLFDLQGRRDAFDSVFQAEAAQLPDAEELHERSRRALAASALDWACRAFDRGRTGTQPVDGLVAFALETYRDAETLPEWRALQRRIKTGSDAAPRRPRFLADALARRAAEGVAQQRWQWTGEW